VSIVLYHHPRSRAATVVWMLEALGLDYRLEHVDLSSGANRRPGFLAINPMGKVPVLVDGDVVLAESAAIGLYLADRYSSGELAPALDDPARGAYLRWILYAPSVVEPACMAQAAGWEYGPGQAGWGRFDDVVATLEGAVAPGPWLLGDRFTMADVVLGSTLRWMLMFGMMPKNAALVAYVERLDAQSSWARATEVNLAAAAQHLVE
jgi:glutathione S-transferase